MIRQILTGILSVSLTFFSFGASKSSSLGVTACSNHCSTVKDTIVKTSFTSSGTEIIEYESGVEVERISNDEWIIRDYPNMFDAKAPEKQSRSWTVIGLAILKYASYVLTACQAVQYISGHDICRIVLSYISTPHGNGTYTYELTGNYIPGYIPGCEPSHSLPCNSGYWEYRVVVQ